MKKILRRIIIGLTVLVAGITLGIVNADPAAADAYVIKNHKDSELAIRVYNKYGCMGAEDRVDPGEESNVGHLWKTFWLRPHYRAHVWSRFSADKGYVVTNISGHSECLLAGRKFNPAGWNVKVYRW